LLLSCEKSEQALRQREDYAACCCVAQNLSLILWERAIGMKWTTGAVTREQRFFDILQLDEGQRSVVGLFWYGYPAEIPRGVRKSPRKFIDVLP